MENGPWLSLKNPNNNNMSAMSIKLKDAKQLVLVKLVGLVTVLHCFVSLIRLNM